MTNHAENPVSESVVATATKIDPRTQASRDIQQRIEGRLRQLEDLCEMLVEEDEFAYEPLDFELPADFKLSIVVPVYNEQSTIQIILSRLVKMPIPNEIIVVDDCSTDNTREMLHPLAELDNVRIVYKPQNEGKGAALRTGFQSAKGDVVMIQDADLEYDPRDMPRLLKPIIDGEADVVYGSRFSGEEQQDPSFLHRFGNRLLTKASNLFTGLKLTDMETCYKAFRREVLADIPLKQDRFGFEPEITAKLARRKARFMELPIRYDARSYDDGKKIGIKDAINAFYCIVRYGWKD